MKIDRTNALDIIKSLNIKPSKDYGQNFLVEPELAAKIVESLNINCYDDVLEIGPGLGSLSHFVALHGVKTTLVDIDSRITGFLSEVYKESNVSVINNDILKTNVSSYSKILSNLPYNITTEIMSYLIKNAINCRSMVLMCQSENFAHFNDLSGKEYGPYSVALHLLGKIQRVITVKAGSFYPAPQCTSVVFRVDVAPDTDHELVNNVFSFSKQMFLNRRKTISNNLTVYLHSKEEALLALNKAGIIPNARPEEITPASYLSLYSAISSLTSMK